MEPLFLTTPSGAIHLLHLPAAAAPRVQILWLPPFAEEAHCARRQMVAAARECSAQGVASVLVDPLGTGESEGDFADARLDVWIENVISAASWLRERSDAPLWLAGVRAGCLLADAAAAQLKPAGLLCWQPVFSGRAVIDAFLRLGLASGWAGDESRSAGQILGGLRDALARGESVDIAGFRLSAGLASDMQALELSPSADCGRVAVLEFRSHQADAGEIQHTPAVLEHGRRWREAGLDVMSVVLEAPSFWAQHEAPLRAGLGAASLDLMGLRA